LTADGIPSHGAEAGGTLLDAGVVGAPHPADNAKTLKENMIRLKWGRVIESTVELFVSFVLH
jgi:hypothetical protein